MENLVSEEIIEETYSKIKDKISKTSLIKADKLSSFSGNNIFLKLENLQKTGSFKIRGALNKILNLSKEQQAKGLIAATKEFGGAKCTVKLCGNMFDDAMSEALRLEKEEGLTLVHPYDDNFVIAGQGTIGLEIYEQMNAMGKEIDYCLVPIGGGGLLSGISIYLKSKNPNIKSDFSPHVLVEGIMKLNEFNNAFQTEQQCLAYIANLKENKCIRCFSFNLNTSDLKRMRCLKCNQTFSILTGTIFSRSQTSLTSWFYLIFRWINTKHGIPSTDIAK